jgi:hypothetical protein
MRNIPQKGTRRKSGMERRERDRKKAEEKTERVGK